MKRHEYQLTPDLHSPSGRSLPDGYTLRSPTPDDRLALADLMLDAYVGTIDYEGETLEQAVAEIDGFLADSAYLDVSWLAVCDDVIDAAAMMAWYGDVPLVGFVMTKAAVKGQGLATVLLEKAVASVWQSGASEIRAFITAGNLPSEAVFDRAGFEVVATHDG